MALFVEWQKATFTSSSSTLRSTECCGGSASSHQPAKAQQLQWDVPNPEDSEGPVESCHGSFGSTGRLQIPLALFQKDVHEVLSQPMPERFCLRVRIPVQRSQMFLGSKAEMPVGGTAYVHHILPAMVAADDPNKWGTIELKLEGRAGSEKGKFMLLYSQSPTSSKLLGNMKERSQPA